MLNVLSGHKVDRFAIGQFDQDSFYIVGVVDNLSHRGLKARILNMEAGISIFISLFTFTWQASRMLPSFSSVALSKGLSVGRRGPPPLRTLHLQAPQVPLPPQAEGRKICFSVSEESRLFPPFTVSWRLPLMSILQSP